MALCPQGIAAGVSMALSFFMLASLMSVLVLFCISFADFPDLCACMSLISTCMCLICSSCAWIILVISSRRSSTLRECTFSLGDMGLVGVTVWYELVVGQRCSALAGCCFSTLPGNVLLTIAITGEGQLGASRFRYVGCECRAHTTRADLGMDMWRSFGLAV